MHAARLKTNGTFLGFLTKSAGETFLQFNLPDTSLVFIFYQMDESESKVNKQAA